jgi:hypothetical protein
MRGYIENALIRFSHEPPDKQQMQPYPHTTPTYGATVQYAKAANSSPAATKAEEKYIRQVIGILLYYGQAVNATIITGLSSLAAAQAKPTAHTVFLIKWLLDHVATNLDAILTYKKSEMVLAVHSDASYLSKPAAKSQVGGHFFCSSDVDDPPNNGALLNISKILKAIMSSAAKAKFGLLYISAREAIPMQHLLEEMGHKQPPIPIQTDNSTAHGVVTNNIQPRRTKAIDMQFHWLRCCDTQDQFHYYWQTSLCGAPYQKTPHNIDFNVHTQCPLSIHAANPSHVRQGFNQLSSNSRSRLIHKYCNKLAVRIFFHSTCVRTYEVRMFHSTPQHRVEWNKYNENGSTPLEYVPTYKHTFHFTCGCTYRQMFVPLHSTSVSGVEWRNSMNSQQ